MQKILVVEDDQRLASLMQTFLQQNGLQVRLESNGLQAEASCRDFQPDLMVLDLMLPGMDGFAICRAVRPWFKAPILMLTAKQSDIDQVLGLELGADDYVIKPIKPPVLLARLRALQRRQVPDSSVVSLLEFGHLRIDRSCREVRLAGELVELTTMEFELLWLLASAAGKTLSRDDILSRMRGIAFDGLNRSVDVYISKLRGKLNDNPREPMCIKTVWGKGYLFNPFAWEL